MKCIWEIPTYRRMVMVISILAVLGSSTLTADLSGDPAVLSWQDDNELHIAILPGKETVLSEISLQSAPPNVTVKGLDVNVMIVHPNPQDLSVKLTDQVGDYSEWLWRQGKVSESHINIAKKDIHRFDGQPVNQKWRLLIQDRGDTTGGYIDSWQIEVYYEEPNQPPNDELSQPVYLYPRWPYTGWVYGATNQNPVNDSMEYTADVWHLFTPPKSREYTFTLNGSLPLMGFTIFDPNMETELACQETNLTEDPLNAQVSMIEGMDYPIRVASLPWTNGNYVICVAPSSLIEPYPKSGEIDVSTDIVLSWDGFTDPSNDSQQTQNAPLQVGSMGLYAIYGNDDRQDQYQVQDSEILAAGDSTIAFLDPHDLIETDWGTYQLSEVKTLAETYDPLCPGEPFANQPLAATCSGFLVAPDVIATAGHCLVCKGSFCNENAAVVFGFAVDSPEQEYYEIPIDDVYYCREIIASRYDSQTDWSLVRLDREVVGHKPLRVRRRGSVPVGQSLLLVGHPLGLPRKYDQGGIVRVNDPQASFFQANLDSFGGNSGSMVLNLTTFEVEGIDVAGYGNSLIKEDGCYHSVQCPDKGCVGHSWAIVTKASEFSDLIPAFELYMGTDRDNLPLVQDGLVLPSYSPGGLQPLTTYYWKVVAIGGCGQIQSPVWSFSTGPEGGDEL